MWPKDRLALERRREILEVCRRHDVTIVEDDVWNIMLEEPAVPFAALDPARAVYITSFSKVIGPGLRIGLMRLPRHNHTSIIAHMNTSEDRLGEGIRTFIADCLRRT